MKANIGGLDGPWESERSLTMKKKENKKFDLIILNSCLPYKSGYEVFREAEVLYLENYRSRPPFVLL